MPREIVELDDTAQINDVELAHQEALKIDEGYKQAEELGIRDMASETIIAHGQRYSVAAAIAECEPFAQMIRSVAKGTESLPEDMKKTVLEGTIKDLVRQAQEGPVPEKVQEKVAAEKTANENVKKN